MSTSENSKEAMDKMNQFVEEIIVLVKNYWKVKYASHNNHSLGNSWHNKKLKRSHNHEKSCSTEKSVREK